MWQSERRPSKGVIQLVSVMIHLLLLLEEVWSSYCIGCLWRPTVDVSFHIPVIPGGFPQPTGGHKGPHHSQPHSRPYAALDGLPKSLLLKAARGALETGRLLWLWIWVIPHHRV